MEKNEVRKDYLLDRWVVIAKERKKRPVDFSARNVTKKEGACSLCPGNEHMTPPAELIYIQHKDEIIRGRDKNGFRQKDWRIRVVPNLYPAFSPPKKEDEINNDSPFLMEAVGNHEVIVESPCHDEHLGVARVSQVMLLVKAYLDRLDSLSKKSYVKHVAVFRNHGREAGASMEHPHSQLIATTFVPSILEEEFEASKQHWKQTGKCRLCSVLEKECNGPRFIWENSSFVIFAPWASINSFEFWILPKRHNSNMHSMDVAEVEELAKTLRVCFGGLRSLLGDPPYNFGFHTLLDDKAKDCYHWHLEVYPRLLIWAGFEKSTGTFINTVAPEEAATKLSKAFQAEKKGLKS